MAFQKHRKAFLDALNRKEIPIETTNVNINVMEVQEIWDKEDES